MGDALALASPPRANSRGAAPRITQPGLIVLAALSVSVLAQLSVVGGLEHRAVQQRALDRFRMQLAEGTAPVGHADNSKHLLQAGTPVALLEIPSIGVRQVVLEGTSGSVLMSGPGHRRDTPLPGQLGTSVIFGRQASYGGPFRELHRIRKGARIVVTTGAGRATFTVIDRRGAGDPTPPPVAAGAGRLQLVTAVGMPFFPSGMVRVDADLTTPASAPDSAAPTTLSHAEAPMAADTSTVWQLVLWLQVLIAAAAGAVWSWYVWGRVQTWVVFFPVLALVGLFAGGQFLKFLPNLL